MSSTEVKSTIKNIRLEGNYLIEQDHAKILDEVTEAIQNGYQRFVLDMTELNHINSAGLSVMIRIMTKARTAGGDAVLANIPEKIKQLLIITKLNSVFNSFDSIEDAKVALTQP
tara:strand:+ start:1007 stop:1348 length:342 start_codon:yes stop_codon:yes gene_type:complete